VDRERWLSTTLRSVGDAVVVCTTDQRVEFMNPVAEDLTGWSEEDAKGRALSEVVRLVEADGEPVVERWVERALRNAPCRAPRRVGCSIAMASAVG